MSEIEEEKVQPTFFVKTFIAYIYFMQGVYLGLCSSTVYLFPVFPTTDVLSYFSLAVLPFSFKYVTAPFVEKFTNIAYGRRKFWIVLSLFMTSFLTIPLSKVFNDSEQYLVTVGILFLIILMISLGDVCIDAASVKQLGNPVLAGWLQSVFQPMGLIVGGIFLIKLNNPTFWSFLGVEGALCTPQIFLRVIAIVGLLIAVLIHFQYKERVTKAELTQKIADFATILKYYKHFVNPRFMLCRQVIYFMVFYQGLKFFTVGYGPQTIYRGFSKQKLAQYDTACVGVALVVNSILSKFITDKNSWRMLQYCYFVQVVAYIGLFYYDSRDEVVVVGTAIFMTLMQYVTFLLHSTKINSYGETQFAGLCLTTLASFSNFGNNSWLQLKCISAFGYQSAVTGGLTLALVIGVFSHHFIEWIKRGEPELHRQAIHLKEN